MKIGVDAKEGADAGDGGGGVIGGHWDEHHPAL